MNGITKTDLPFYCNITTKKSRLCNIAVSGLLIIELSTCQFIYSVDNGLKLEIDKRSYIGTHKLNNQLHHYHKYNKFNP